MPAERTTMRQLREVLRLKFVGGVPTREIARRKGVAASTVRATIKRFWAAGLSWPLPEEMTDAALEARLFTDARALHRAAVLVRPSTCRFPYSQPAPSVVTGRGDGARDIYGLLNALCGDLQAGGIRYKRYKSKPGRHRHDTDKS
jgi:transposase-like protein